MRPLRSGDTIGIVAPAFAPDPKIYDIACAALGRRGFATKLFGVSGEQFGRMSAPDTVRTEALHDAFRDPLVGAIICARGGHGSGRLLEQLDAGLIAANPKPFVGYSDITNLLNLFERETGLVGFHGPMLTDLATKDDAWSWQNLLDVLQGEVVNYDLASDSFTALTTGHGEGRLVGGNISILCSMIGAGLRPPSEDVVVLLEDVGEFMFRLDRALLQLKRFGFFTRARGVIIADMKLRDRGHDNSLGMSIESLLEDHLGDLKIPIALDLPCGHTERQMTLPIGAPCTFDVTSQRCAIGFHGLWTAASRRVA